MVFLEVRPGSFQELLVGSPLLINSVLCDPPWIWSPICNKDLGFRSVLLPTSQLQTCARVVDSCPSCLCVAVAHCPEARPPPLSVASPSPYLLMTSPSP